MYVHVQVQVHVQVHVCERAEKYTCVSVWCAHAFGKLGGEPLPKTKSPSVQTNLQAELLSIPHKHSHQTCALSPLSSLSFLHPPTNKQTFFFNKTFKRGKQEEEQKKLPKQNTQSRR